MSQTPGFSVLMILAVSTLFACTSAPPAESPSGAAKASKPRPITADFGPEMDAEGRPLPPVAPKRRTTQTVAGETLVDDYGWLRERDNPAVISYLEAENRYTERMMAHTEALQKELYEEMVARIQETDLSVPQRVGEYYYYSRTEEGKQYDIWCRRRGSMEAPEEVILDENVLAEGLDYFRLGNLEVSPNGKLVAYLVDTDGSERMRLRVKDLTTGEVLPDEAENAGWALAWGGDDQTLFYVTLDDTNRPYRLWRHVLGRSEDEMLFEEADGAYFVNVAESRSRKYVWLRVGSSTTSEASYLESASPRGDFRVILPRRQGIEYNVVHQGDHFYMRTNDGAKNFRLLRSPASDLSPESWEEVLPGRDDVTLSAVDAFAKYLVLTEREDGLARIRVRDQSSGETHSVSFPEPVYTVRATDNPEYDTQVLRLTYTSLVTPMSVFDYDMADRTRELRKQMEVRGGYDPSLYVSERIHAVAADGTEVPVSLVYRRDLDRSRPQRTLLHGYGSYGVSMEPFFRSTNLSLLDRGFIYAMAHIRGGGEMGETWHDHGKLLEKRNTFTDFVAVAQHLVDEGLTTPEQLAIQGGSAGGLLMGAVVNMRPDLFGAVIAQVPFVDVMNTMLDPSLPLTITEYEEWGNPNEAESFAYMRSYSPYDNVSAQAYPPMLITGGLNDPRVSYWEPAKWSAKLREMRTDDNLQLLKVNMGAGHSGASGRYNALEERAFELAFLLDTLPASPSSASASSGSSARQTDTAP